MNPETNFSRFGLQEEILKAISLLDYKQPTNVQSMLIEAMLNQRDVVVQSQTGSGKTAAFAIPICNALDWNENKPQALILTPTRELALQVKQDVFHIGRFKRIKVSVLIGQTPFAQQERELKQKTHIVVGTPGRVMDHLSKNTLDLSELKYLVIDEADEMLDLGFIPQMDEILKTLRRDRQTVLLSATIPYQIQSLIENYCVDPQIVVIEEDNRVSDRILQYKYDVIATAKLKSLKEVLTVENPESCILFANQKATVDEITKELLSLNYPVRKLHGGLEQKDRTQIINDFKHGVFRYLVATDVAARGLDIDNVGLIFNYDCPLEGEAYVHRIGRTGRFDKSGKAITFVTTNQGKYMHRIETFIQKELTPYLRPTADAVLAARPMFTKTKNEIPTPKKQKGAAFDREILKLQINGGKQSKIRPVDVVGALCALPGIDANDIGVIAIGELKSEVEILNFKGNQVFNLLQNTPIKGKIRKVTKVVKE